MDIGAAWEKTSREGRDYISVKLDDPSFPAAIYATLSETGTAGEYALGRLPLLIPVSLPDCAP